MIARRHALIYLLMTMVSGMSKEKILSLFSIPASIAALSISLRLMFPGTFVFKEDEARALLYGIDIARDHTLLTHTWPSSVGIANSPVFAYIISIFAHISSAPLFVTLCLNVMNLASVFVVYPIFKRILENREEAHLAVLFYAISPVAIYYSRKIWDPVPLPFFSSIVVYAAMKVLYEKRSRWIFPLVFFIAITAQIHQSGVFFSFLVIIVIIMHRPRINYPFLGLGIFAGFLCLLPYLTYLIASGFRELLAYNQRFGNEFPDIDVVSNFLLNLTGHNIYSVAGHDAVSLLNWPLPGFGAVTGVLMLLFLPVAYHGAAELYSRSSLRLSPAYPFLRVGGACGYNLLLICTFGLPFLYLVFRVPGVAHYFVVTFSATFSLLALGITRIKARYRKGIIRRSLFLLPILWVLQITCFFSMTSYRNGGYSFGPSYGYSKSIAGKVIAEARRTGESGDHDGGVRAFPRGELAERAADTVHVYIRAPRLSSHLPVQWRFIFEREFGVVPELPNGGPYYLLTLSWHDRLWSKGTHSVKLVAPVSEDHSSGIPANARPSLHGFFYLE